MNTIQLETPREEIEPQPSFANVLEQAARHKERMTLNYKDKIFVALIPMEQPDLIEKIEECIDIATIQERQNEDSISLTELKKELGL